MNWYRLPRTWWRKCIDLPVQERSADLLASNTPHIVFDEISRRPPIPLISIVQATCAAAKTLGLKRLGLFGTRFTVQGRFYPAVSSRRTLCLPSRRASLCSLHLQAYVHYIYMNE